MDQVSKYSESQNWPKVMPTPNFVMFYQVLGLEYKHLMWENGRCLDKRVDKEMSTAHMPGYTAKNRSERPEPKLKSRSRSQVFRNWQPAPDWLEDILWWIINVCKRWLWKSFTAHFMPALYIIQFATHRIQGEPLLKAQPTKLSRCHFISAFPIKE